MKQHFQGGFMARATSGAALTAFPPRDEQQTLSERTRLGWAASANSCTIIPPIDAPTRCTHARCRPSKRQADRRQSAGACVPIVRRDARSAAPTVVEGDDTVACRERWSLLPPGLECAVRPPTRTTGSP